MTTAGNIKAIGKLKRIILNELPKMDEIQAEKPIMEKGYAENLVSNIEKSIKAETLIKNLKSFVIYEEVPQKIKGFETPTEYPKTSMKSMDSLEQNSQNAVQQIENQITSQKQIVKTQPGTTSYINNIIEKSMRQLLPESQKPISVTKVSTTNQGMLKEYIKSISSSNVFQGLSDINKQAPSFALTSRFDMAEKQSTKNLLKQMLSSDTKLKETQEQPQKFDQLYKQLQKNDLKLEQDTTQTTRTAMPSIPTGFDIPFGAFIPPIFPGGNEGGKKRGRPKKKYSEVKAVFPDFTAKALELDPEKIAMKDVDKILNKIQTGFGVRRGARLI
jgi:hypothetical protein